MSFIREWFIYYAEKYSRLANPSSSWGVITGTNRELQMAIISNGQINAAISSLTLFDINILLERLLSELVNLKRNFR